MTTTNGHTNGHPRTRSVGGDMIVETDVSLEVGRRYKFRGMLGQKDPQTGIQRWKYPPSVYRCLGLALAYRTGQRLVVYIGCGGDHDEGVMHLACLTDWDEQFMIVDEWRPAEKPAASAAPSGEKVAGPKDVGSGV